MTEFIAKAIAEHTLGLALHYPLLYASVLGLGGGRTLEFGAGGSTRVILDAHGATGQVGSHYSISCETQNDLRHRYEIVERGVSWHHFNGLSEKSRDIQPGGPFDLVLHDGSHTADVVAADVRWVWSKLRCGGLLLVHDVLHSGCGDDVRTGLISALACESYELSYLPYGFGLAVACKTDGPGEVKPAREKIGSKYFTDVSWLRSR